MVVRRGRHTKTKQRHVRGHHKVSQLSFVECSNCKTSVLPHQVCANCGYYKGRKVIDVLAHLEKKARKEKEKELASAKAEHKEQPLDAKELSKK